MEYVRVSWIQKIYEGQVEGCMPRTTVERARGVSLFEGALSLRDPSLLYLVITRSLQVVHSGPYASIVGSLYSRITDPIRGRFECLMR